MTGLAPDLHNDSTQRIAGQRIRRCPQCAFHLGRVHCHQQSRIEPELTPATHRYRAGFDRGKVLPHPEQRLARTDALRQPCDEARRRGTLPPFREHLVHGATRETALQHRIRFVMTKRYPGRHIRGRARFDARYVIAQARKRPCACMHLAHAPLSVLSEIKKFVTAEPFTGSIVHDMF
jgi:hypothetical protein